MWKPALTLVLAAAATLASSFIPAKVFASYPEIMGCELSCPTAAGGWPLPYLIDYPGISPVGPVSPIEALLGDDIIWHGALTGTFSFWLLLIAASSWALGRARQRSAAQS